MTVKEMNPEVYTKQGKLRKHPPVRFHCRMCGHPNRRTDKLKLPGVTFHACACCGSGKLDTNPSYTEWMEARQKAFERGEI